MAETYNAVAAWDPAAHGGVRFFHNNSYEGQRASTAGSKEDLPSGISQRETSALNQGLLSHRRRDISGHPATELSDLLIGYERNRDGYSREASVFDSQSRFTVLLLNRNNLAPSP